MKKKQLFGMILMIVSILFIPNNINAKEEKVMCKYMYKDKELVYTINSKVDVPFTDGENNWYHADNFKENYLKSAKTNSINYTDSQQDHQSPVFPVPPLATTSIIALTRNTTKKISAAYTARLINLLCAALTSFSSLAITALPKSITA